MAKNFSRINQQSLEYCIHWVACSVMSTKTNRGIGTKGFGAYELNNAPTIAYKGIGLAFNPSVHFTLTDIREAMQIIDRHFLEQTDLYKAIEGIL